MATDLTEMRDGVRQQVLGTLMDKIRQEHYPSVTMLNMVEEMLGPDELPIYAELLMQKVRDDNFPSMDMIKRLRALC